jgi:hypothetical protein
MIRSIILIRLRRRCRSIVLPLAHRRKGTGRSVRQPALSGRRPLPARGRDYHITLPSARAAERHCCRDTRSSVSARSGWRSRTISTARFQRATCGRRPLMRSLGTFRRAFARSNSDRCDARTSLLLAAVKIVNSNAPALMLLRARRFFYQRRKFTIRHGGVVFDLVHLGLRRQQMLESFPVERIFATTKFSRLARVQYRFAPCRALVTLSRVVPAKCRTV